MRTCTELHTEKGEKSLKIDVNALKMIEPRHLHLFRGFSDLSLENGRDSSSTKSGCTGVHLLS